MEPMLKHTELAETDKPRDRSNSRSSSRNQRDRNKIRDEDEEDGVLLIPKTQNEGQNSPKTAIEPESTKIENILQKRNNPGKDKTDKAKKEGDKNKDQKSQEKTPKNESKGLPQKNGSGRFQTFLILVLSFVAFIFMQDHLENLVGKKVDLAFRRKYSSSKKLLNRLETSVNTFGRELDQLKREFKQLKYLSYLEEKMVENRLKVEKLNKTTTRLGGYLNETLELIKEASKHSGGPRAKKGNNQFLDLQNLLENQLFVNNNAKRARKSPKRPSTFKEIDFQLELKNRYSGLKNLTKSIKRYNKYSHFEINEQTYKEDKIYIYVVPHSHTDLGWLKTIDAYYQQDVKHILDSSLRSLPFYDRKFSFSDIGFIDIWWKKSSKLSRERLTKLVKSGKFELVNCAISMNDALLPHFSDILDNFFYGRKYCSEKFDRVSETAWFVDLFGFSSTMADLLAQMGFKNLVINRVSYDEKEYRKNTSRLLYNWVTAGSATNSTKTPENQKNEKYEKLKLLTNIMYWHYNSTLWAYPKYVWFVENPLDFKFGARVNTILTEMNDDLEQVKNYYKQKLIFMPYGDDFLHTNMVKTTSMMDCLFILLESNQGYKNLSRFKFKYSTPTEYFEDLVKTSELSGKPIGDEKNVNFEPYADVPNAYWTGFYSTRPDFKLNIRKFLFGFKALKQFYAITCLQKTSPVCLTQYADMEREIDELGAIAGIMLHHDAITGTSLYHVISDYYNMIQEGVDKVMGLYRKLLEDHLFKADPKLSKGVRNVVMRFYTPHEIIRVKEGAKHQKYGYVLAVQSQELGGAETVEIDLASPFLTAYANNLKIEVQQMVCFEYNQAAPDDKNNHCRLYIKTPSIDPYQMLAIELKEEENPRQVEYKVLSQCTSFDLGLDSQIEVLCNEEDLSLLKINTKENKSFYFEVTLSKYFSHLGGHYIFRPASGTMQAPVTLDKVPENVKFFDSDMMLYLRFAYNSHILRVVRYKNSTEELDFEVTTYLDSYDITTINKTGGIDGIEIAVDFRTDLIESTYFEVCMNGMRPVKKSKPVFHTYVNDYVDDYNLGACKTSQDVRRFNHVSEGFYLPNPPPSFKL